MFKKLIPVVASLVCLCSFVRAAGQVKPNVIFVFSDDQRYNSLGMTGDPVTKTPNLDRLAKEGVLFRRAFITSPICGPSRANMFTGQWERKNHIGFNYVSKTLSETGHRTGVIEIQRTIIGEVYAVRDQYVTGAFYTGLSLGQHLPGNRATQHHFCVC